MQMIELSRSAFTPIGGPLRSDTVLVPMAVTLSRLTPGRLTVEGTLAYQITAGRLAQFCGRLLDEMPSGSAEGAATFVAGEMQKFLGPLAGEQPEESVTVTVGAV
jgi:hypothetical protein